MKIIKKIVFFIILFCLSAIVCFAQKSKPPVRSNAPKQTPVQPLKEVPEADWKVLIDAVQSENWGKSAALSGDYLRKIKIENDKKQIARLRYILLYALAGKIVALSLDGKKPEENRARVELEKAANGFTGKEFFMPSRQISNDCQGKLNYLCPAKQQRNVLRATAASQTGTAIYSFEYVRLRENFNFGANIGKQAIVGGVLQKIEFNSAKSNLWIMRLFFENGTINIVPDS